MIFNKHNNCKLEDLSHVEFVKVEDLFEDKYNSVIVLEENHERNIYLNNECYSEQELIESNFKNLSGKEWNSKKEYVSHPINKNSFIERDCYKDFILREIMNDVVNYILDNFGVSFLTVGLVTNANTSSNFDLGLSIPIVKINANAKINVSISQKYSFTGTGYEKSFTKHNYTWVDKFPEVITAVEHNAKSFERVESVENSLFTGFGLSSHSVVSPLFDCDASYSRSSNNDLYIYISYTQ